MTDKEAIEYGRSKIKTMSDEIQFIGQWLNALEYRSESFVEVNELGSVVCPKCKMILVFSDEAVSEYEPNYCGNCGKKLCWEGFYGFEKRDGGQDREKVTICP